MRHALLFWVAMSLTACDLLPEDRPTMQIDGDCIDFTASPVKVVPCHLIKRKPQ